MTDSLQRNLGVSHLRPAAWPFPHAIADQFFRPAVYEKLRHEFPHIGTSLTPGNGERSLYWGDDEYERHLEESPSWKDVFQMVQSQDYLAIINDDESPGFHQVYLNRSHPEDPNPAWYGNNVGTWDGDTLVVDRIAFDERIWLDQAGHPHSPKLHLTERYRRPDLGHLELEVTVADPGILAEPYTIKRVAELAQGYDIYEFICAENERDVPHMVGK